MATSSSGSISLTSMKTSVNRAHLGDHLSHMPPFWKYRESAPKLYLVILLLVSIGTNRVLNKHGDIDKYGPNAIPSESMQCYSYQASYMNQHLIVIGLH